MRNIHNRVAFTLVELIIVIAIITLLAGIIVITIQPQSIFINARNSQRLNDLVTLQTAISKYVADSPITGVSQRSYNDFAGYSTLLSNSFISNGLWHLEGTGNLSNGVSINDNSGYKNDLITENSNGTTLAYTNGLFGTSINFDGIDDALRQKPSATQVDFPIVSTNSTSITLTGNATQYSSSKPYSYMIILSGTSESRWGYIGSCTFSSPNSICSIYTTKSGSTNAWNGSSGTPNSYIIKRTDFQFSGQNSFSLGAWVKTTNPSATYPNIIAKVGGDPTRSYHLSLDNTNHPYFELSSDGANYTGMAMSSVAIDGNWHFIVGTYDGANIIIYVDGVQTGTTPNTTGVNDNISDLYIGRSGRGYYFTGLIDEPFVTSTLLSSTQILNMYNGNGVCQNITSNFSTNLIQGALNINTSGSNFLNINPLLNNGYLPKTLKDPDGTNYKACYDSYVKKLIIFAPDIEGNNSIPYLSI